MTLELPFTHLARGLGDRIAQVVHDMDMRPSVRRQKSARKRTWQQIGDLMGSLRAPETEAPSKRPRRSAHDTIASSREEAAVYIDPSRGLHRSPSEQRTWDTIHTILQELQRGH